MVVLIVGSPGTARSVVPPSTTAASGRYSGAIVTCPNCKLMREIIAKEIEASSDPMTISNLQHLLAATEPDPAERGETPLFVEGV